MLEVKNVSKSYGSTLAVNNLSFTVQPGDIFGLLGTNGAGKTTMFRMILNLFEPDKGEVLYNGKQLTTKDASIIGYLPEERSLIKNMTVKTQIYYLAKLRGMTTKEIDERTNYYLKRFQILDYKNSKIKALSKGNAQKIQFICAIIHSPKILVLDEPFSGLDPINVDIFKEIILELKKQNTMIIFSSHQMTNIEEFCERLLILLKGENVLSGQLKDIKKSKPTRSVKIIGDVNESMFEIDGVVEVEKLANELIVKVESEAIIPKIFERLHTISNITHFEVMLPSLHEIFVEIGTQNE